MVTQDTSLLHRSIRDNIAYGRPEAGDAEIDEAAAPRPRARVHRSSSRTIGAGAGYDAHVGERGVKLSGGQRQRIAIARVILKDAPILVLDEATSALDSEVEAAIQEALSTLMEGKTVIAIAHRLSTIAALDRLIVIDRGRIVEEGSHARAAAARRALRPPVAAPVRGLPGRGSWPRYDRPAWNPSNRQHGLRMDLFFGSDSMLSQYLSIVRRGKRALFRAMLYGRRAGPCQRAPAR